MLGTASDADRRALLRAYREDGDLGARDRLIEGFLPVVRSIARRYAGRGELVDDLEQVASVGLVKAIDRFDLDRDVEVITYVVPTVVGEIKRHFRDRVWAVRVPRPVNELYMRLSQLLEDLTATLGRSPTIRELAEASGAQEEDVIEALEARSAYATRSLNSLREGDESGESELIDSIEDEERGYEDAENRQLLAPGLETLTERERRIVNLRFVQGLTQSQIAVEIGMSQMHVSRLLGRTLEKLSKEIDLP